VGIIHLTLQVPATAALGARTLFIENPDEDEAAGTGAIKRGGLNGSLQPRRTYRPLAHPRASSSKEEASSEAKPASSLQTFS